MRLLKIFVILLCASGLTAGAQMQFDAARKLQVAEHVIQHYYVDTLNIDRVVEQGIVAMLKELDPHSTYTTAAETKALTEPLNGNFSGIGVQFQMVQDTVYVIQAVAQGPSEKVGIIPGDRIVAANDTAIAGVKMATSDVMKRLRGPKGSIVNLKVVRRSEPDTLTFRVKRDDIPLYTIDASFMADPQTGYIRVSSFGAETGKEFARALEKLRKQGMKNLIIDLQDNGGGYLSASVDLAQMFLPKGSTVVYTAGLNQNPQYFRAEESKPDLEGRVIVLVNEYSASASEILSGALQDNDRGVIVGRRTFGKGLVQRPFPFPDGSMIRLTTAHYYTPSGRTIQKPYEKGHGDDYQQDLKKRFEHGEFYSADSIKFDENLKFRTLNGRTVYGGGGIMPDFFVPIDTAQYTDYHRQLAAKGVIIKSTTGYIERHRQELKAKYKNFDSFHQKFQIDDAFLTDLRALADKEKIAFDETQYQRSLPLIRTQLKALIARDLWDMSEYYQVMNGTNQSVQQALRVLREGKYEEVLKP